MKTSNKFPVILIFVLTISAFQGFSQSYPSGGYQGGTHGNLPYTLWTGQASDDWSDPDNWCPAAVPDEDINVVIPADAVLMPEVKTSGLSCKSLTIEDGAELTIKTGYTLTVDGQPVE